MWCERRLCLYARKYVFCGVEVTDTVGAGDSFTAAFCASLLHGKNIAEAHRLAVEVSAFVCTRHGAMPELPVELKERLG